MLSPPPVLQQIPGDEAAAQSLAEGINPNIPAAEYSLAAAEEDVRIATSALLPNLDLESALRYDDGPNLAVDWQRGAAIGLQLRVPLYQGGRE